jgi:hypothetical protein
MFTGFSPEVQAKHEQYLIDRFGGGMKEGITQSKERVKNWTKADWERSGGELNQICHDLVSVMARELPAESPDVQDVIRRHYEWLNQFWTPTRDSYAGHGLLIVESELRRPFEAHHSQLPEYMSAAMKIFAQRELS